jgi:TolB protein
LRRALLPLIALLLVATPARAQWTNRYQKVEPYGHHVYLEGYELPTMNAGPTAPAVSPDGMSVAFSARGWIWVLDLQSGRARRVTDGAAMDFRPAWSQDGSQLAFVRDDSRDTWIVVRDVETGAETTLNTDAIELDPTFGRGEELIYASATAGGIDLWDRNGEMLFERSGIEVAPSLSDDGAVLVYVNKGGGDRIVARDRVSGEERVLATERILSQTRPEVSPDGRLVVYNWATQDGYELRVVAIDDPTTTVRIATGLRGMPLEPTWGPRAQWIWYTEAGRDEVMRLYRVAAVGGEPEEVPIRVWDWAGDTGVLRVTTRRVGEPGPVAARLAVRDGDGHPASPSTSYPQFGVGDGRIFFYTPGVIELIMPAGEATVSAVRGLVTPEITRTVEVPAGGVAEVGIDLEPVWDARAAGYLSGDHHFHLNYGGPYRLEPDDLVAMMDGENLDVATPLLANLHNRFEDQQYWGWEHDGRLPLIRFGQEVRSHFLGHLGLLDSATLFWPWIWGPGYQVYGADDRPNGEALAHARAEGGLAGYVHPADGYPNEPGAPFAAGSLDTWPVMQAVDGVLGNMDWLEVACLWVDEIGTSETWYRFLNLGVPILLEAGTDVMNNFYRTMAVGTTRIYVNTDGNTSFEAYWRGFREGRSFVTTGPVLLLDLDGAEPGDATAGGRLAAFRIDLASAVPVERVEVVVNGQVQWSETGLAMPGAKEYAGTIELPAAGWVAVRAHGGAQSWPAMDQRVFAHTSPVWIDHVGSVDPDAAARAAADLMPVIDAAWSSLRAAYGDAPTPRIDAEFEAARDKLREAMGQR